MTSRITRYLLGSAAAATLLLSGCAGDAPAEEIGLSSSEWVAVELEDAQGPDFLVTYEAERGWSMVLQGSDLFARYQADVGPVLHTQIDQPPGDEPGSSDSGIDILDMGGGAGGQVFSGSFDSANGFSGGTEGAGGFSGSTPGAAGFSGATAAAAAFAAALSNTVGLSCDATVFCDFLQGVCTAEGGTGCAQAVGACRAEINRIAVPAVYATLVCVVIEYLNCLLDAGIGIGVDIGDAPAAQACFFHLARAGIDDFNL